ncbi:GNAT family N-acetyltransferase [Saccharothrix algeriensis]|uniref:GNAT family N-acetyltransferase n=1 Tax=Saccharothrix algeriensis TaxID=173560 RepID=A0A8T8HTU1_9PSEU|nr:GNAT family N-acetyltransferase [Saccharothrix algeriensis]MBM7813200.1 RimJ/RimL family protein N-acetyltransferase [Saccharothrix algeriensis]QTR01779.1 GNAT family N-acetyltransferase [Saccharothrix algeriensis]
MTAYPEEIRTDRLLLRRVGPGDLRAAVEVLTDPEAGRHDAAGVPTPEEARELLAEWREHWAREGIGYWAVVLPGTGEVIGFGGLRHHRLGGEPTLNLFYRFSPRHRGRGYAPEMARAAVEWAGRALPDRPVVIIVDHGNAPSRRVAEKLGFAHVGESTTIDGPVLVYRRQGATAG